jgi:hypothetical protein
MLRHLGRAARFHAERLLAPSEEKASAKSAGAGRQYNGRLGKVEMSQVGVLLSYVNLKVAQGFWSWIV